MVQGLLDLLLGKIAEDQMHIRRVRLLSSYTFIHIMDITVPYEDVRLQSVRVVQGLQDLLLGKVAYEYTYDWYDYCHLLET